MDLHTVVFSGYTIKNLLTYGVILVVLFIFVKVIKAMLMPNKRDRYSQVRRCPKCGWQGQVSVYAGRCPQCNRKLGEQRAKK